jgi:hypothetical protein
MARKGGETVKQQEALSTLHFGRFGRMDASHFFLHKAAVRSNGAGYDSPGQRPGKTSDRLR